MVPSKLELEVERYRFPNSWQGLEVIEFVTGTGHGSAAQIAQYRDAACYHYALEIHSRPYNLLPVYDLAVMADQLGRVDDMQAILRRTRAALKPGGLLILETNVDLQHVPAPATAYYGLNGEDEELAGTTTHPVLWGPNSRCVVAMLMRAGFDTVTVFSPHEAWPGRAVFHAR